MEACYSVELGADDAVLEVPWNDPEHHVQYLDTRTDPALVCEIPEAQIYPELQDFLLRANDVKSGFHSAKCDVWTTEELEYEDIVFNATTKVGGYVDLVFTDARRYAFEEHEAFARKFAKRVRMSDDIPATAELIVRRLYEENASQHDAFYFTLYVFGFGNEPAEARGQWAHALSIVAEALFG